MALTLDRVRSLRRRRHQLSQTLLHRLGIQALERHVLLHAKVIPRVKFSSTPADSRINTGVVGDAAFNFLYEFKRKFLTPSLPLLVWHRWNRSSCTALSPVNAALDISSPSVFRRRSSSSDARRSLGRVFRSGRDNPGWFLVATKCKFNSHLTASRSLLLSLARGRSAFRTHAYIDDVGNHVQHVLYHPHAQVYDEPPLAAPSIRKCSRARRNAKECSRGPSAEMRRG